MNNDPSLRKADISDVDDQLRAPEAADTEGHRLYQVDDTDTEGHVRFMLDEQGNPDVASPDDSDKDTEGHIKL